MEYGHTVGLFCVIILYLITLWIWSIEQSWYLLVVENTICTNFVFDAIFKQFLIVVFMVTRVKICSLVISLIFNYRSANDGRCISLESIKPSVSKRKNVFLCAWLELDLRRYFKKQKSDTWNCVSALMVESIISVSIYVTHFVI